MQFVANGPDIPDALLQAHEDGRVVFFCGAGISYPAGLPGFKELVDDIYQLVGTTRKPDEENAYKHYQFDATLNLLERRLPGQRVAVRNALVQILQPKLRRKGAVDTHAALLQLGRSRDGALRLVTTNFDRIFEKVAKRTRQMFCAYAAPMLPIPKNSRWNGLVYLHGLLPDKPDDDALHRLVLTSGDFGLAYLTERWAARFVSELFRNYVVCFVGYSINDPVLRYMMDALAADRMMGEATPKAYALGDCEPGQEYRKAIEWEAKGVTPILYAVPAGSHNHTALHNSLKVWAETYRLGTLGKERIVVNYALARPSVSTKQDDFVSRMLWAISHESGLPAQRFADFNPVPSLEWLEVFSEKRYQHSDLSRFGVPPRSDVDDKLRFSLIHRPAPYTHAPWMELVVGKTADSQWDHVVHHLVRWLVRHLNDPTLIIWLAQRGGQLNDIWSVRIEEKLDWFARLEREGKLTELEEIRTNAPDAIPSPLMQTLWRLLLTGRVRSPWHDGNLYRWQGRLKRYGLTTTLRLELRELLSPKIRLKKPFHWGADAESAGTLQRLSHLVDWELVLTADDVHSFLHVLTDDQRRATFPALLDDFQQLLCDALDLLHELGEADNYSDRSYWDIPSISSHWQNRGFRSWVSLIELLRDAWLVIRDIDTMRASRIAKHWFDLSYPTFKRLALFAASQDDCIESDQWVDWLVADCAWWLWSVDTQREVMRLLVLQGKKLSPAARDKLETAILIGPPKEMFRDDIAPERWQLMVNHSVWLRLAKLRDSGVDLGDIASNRFDDLSAANSAWELASNESDEFPRWMSGTGDPDFEAKRVSVNSPRTRDGLVQWLKQHPPKLQLFYEDDWRETCRSRFFHSFYALCELSQEGLWPVGRWGEALQAWSEEGKVQRSWRFAAPLLQAMPTEYFHGIARDVSWWLEAVSKSADRYEAIFLVLCRRVLALPQQNVVHIDRPVTRAINHPVGLITQALLNLWLKREPNDDDKLPSDIEPFFTQLCDIGVEQFRHGRVLLASRLIALFRVDRIWTEAHLLPLFTWSTNAIEAKAVWEGFLWSPLLYGPLMVAFKSQFLETARHYVELGEHSRQFARFLTYAALDPVDGYISQDFEEAIQSLPSDGLREVAQALWQALEGAGEQREEYWKNRIQPFWQRVWPKSLNLASKGVAEYLACLSISAGSEFPVALSLVMDWLQPVMPYQIEHLLVASDMPRRFPKDTLCLLDAVIDNQSTIFLKLDEILQLIAQIAPHLTQDARFQRLSDYSRQRKI